jgi:hypothetical protein
MLGSIQYKNFCPLYDNENHKHNQIEKYFTTSYLRISDLKRRN